MHEHNVAESVSVIVIRWE